MNKEGNNRKKAVVSLFLKKIIKKFYNSRVSKCYEKVRKNEKKRDCNMLN